MKSGFLQGPDAKESLPDPEMLVVEKLLNNGCGLARRGNGEIVFIPDGLPGESFLVTRLTKRKGVARMRDGRRLSEAPERANPPCPHYRQCGGCGLLHLKREAEPRAKTAMLDDTLRRLGKITSFQIHFVDFALNHSRIRGKLHVDRKGHIGFKAFRDDRITAMDQCLVVPESIRNMPRRLAGWLESSRFTGEIYFATDVDGQQPVLELIGSGPRAEPPPLSGNLAGAVIKDINGHVISQTGRTTIAFNWNGRKIQLEPSRFFQSNPASWPVFFAWVDAYLEKFKPNVIWDMHAGSGFLTSRVRGPQIFCGEPDPRAYRSGSRILGSDCCQWFQVTAEQMIERPSFPLNHLDGILIDPPRSGLSTVVRDWLLDAGPASLVYFSCDMGSFARDLRALSEKYEIASPILAMNVNPGTLRLELSVFLARRG